MLCPSRPRAALNSPPHVYTLPVLSTHTEWVWPADTLTMVMPPREKKGILRGGYHFKGVLVDAVAEEGVEGVVLP